MILEWWWIKGTDIWSTPLIGRCWPTTGVGDSHFCWSLTILAALIWLTREGYLKKPGPHRIIRFCWQLRIMRWNRVHFLDVSNGGQGCRLIKLVTFSCTNFHYLYQWTKPSVKCQFTNCPLKVKGILLTRFWALSQVISYSWWPSVQRIGRAKRGSLCLRERALSVWIWPRWELNGRLQRHHLRVLTGWAKSPNTTQ